MTSTEENHPSANHNIRWFIRILHSSELIQGVFLVIAWLAIWQAGRLVEYTEHASVWFPAAGFTFSCFLVLGRKAFVPILTAAIIVTIWNGNHYQMPLTLDELVWAGFLFGLAHIGPYWLGATGVGYLSRKTENNAPKLIITFLVVAGISALITTGLVIMSLVATHQMQAVEVSKTLLPFWVGDMAGVVVLTPLFSGILIYLFPKTQLNLTNFTQVKLGSFKNLIGKMVLNIFLIVATMLLAYIFESRESSFAIFFLAVTHMWIASTESPTFNVVSLATSSIVIVLLVHLFGLMEHVMVYQFAINVIAANALFGIAIPQLRAYNNTLESMVSTDALTKVSSRHFLEQQVDLEIAKCHEQNIALSLVIFDMDNFKVINDKYGHAAGDKVLKNVCQKVKESLRDDDVIARFGGDEFILLLPGLDENSVFHRIEKIKKDIHEIKISGTLISSSFGVAELHPAEDFESLFHRADRALYQSKSKGGNQISRAIKPS